MKTLIGVLLFTFIVALAFMALPAKASGARPQQDLALFLALNGEPTRPTVTTTSVLADGGTSTTISYLSLTTTDAGIGTATVVGGGVYFSPGCFSDTTGTPLAVNVCVPASSWDGGCNNTNTDINYGVPLAAGEKRWWVLTDATTTLAAAPQSGATMYCPLFKMQ